MVEKHVFPGARQENPLNPAELLELSKTLNKSSGGIAFTATAHTSFSEIKFAVKPTSGVGFSMQLNSCLKNLETALSQMGIPKEMVCQQSIYSMATPQELEATCARHFFGSTPPTSYIAEPPIGGFGLSCEHLVLMPRGGGIGIKRRQVTLEAGSNFEETIIENNNARITKTAVEHEKYGMAKYTVVEGKNEKFKRIYAAGLSGGTEDIEDSARGAFELQKMILEKEGMDFIHILCQRNFIEDIDGENYHAFNGVRRIFYGNAFTPGHLHNDWPAATGIGQDGNGVVITFIAEQSGKRRVCVDNPGQTRSDSYAGEFQATQAVTKKTGMQVGMPISHVGAGKPVNRPAFSRALILAASDPSSVDAGDVLGELFISGTASITGKKEGGRHIPYSPKDFTPQYVNICELEKIVGNDKLKQCGLKIHEYGGKIFAETAVEAQTLDLINNIARLISPENLEGHNINGYARFDDLKRLWVYVKNPQDEGKVQQLCGKIFGETPITYVKADVCYSDLLVEIGGSGAIRKKDKD